MNEPLAKLIEAAKACRGTAESSRLAAEGLLRNAEKAEQLATQYDTAIALLRGIE